MRLKKLLISVGLCLFGAAAAMAQDTFPIVLTTEDGLPAQQADTRKLTNEEGHFESRVYTSSEAINKVRFTVVHTATYDEFLGGGFCCFSLSELTVKDGDGNAIALTKENINANATETWEGSVAGLIDGDKETYYHSSWGGALEPIYGEHYVEINLPEPLYSFSFVMDVRQNNKKGFPNVMGITINGAEYVPYGEYGMQMGDETTAQAGKLVVLKSCDAEGTTDLYPAYTYQTNPKKAVPCTRTTPAADCLFILEEADGGYRVRNYMRNSYLKNIASVGTVTLTDKRDAGIYSFENGAISSNGFNLILGEGGLKASDSESAEWTILNASIENTVPFAELKTAIDSAANMLSSYEAELTEWEYNGEIGELKEEIATATAMWEAGSADAIAISDQINALYNKTTLFYALKLWLYNDEIESLVDNTEFQNEVGCKPISQQTVLQNLIEELQLYITDPEGITMTGISSWITRIEAALAAFEESTIVETVFPIDLSTGCPNPAPTTHWEWNSPLFFLAQPTEKFRMTVVSTNTGDNGGGYPCFALAEMFVYDENGDKMDLTIENFYTNAQEPSEGPLEGICDGDLNTCFISNWSQSSVDGQHYVEVTLPEATNCFSFGFISRNTRTVPVDICVGIEEWVPVDSLGFELGEKVTDPADLAEGNLYAMYGNLGVVSDGETGGGFYNGVLVTGFNADRFNAFELEAAGEDSYRIHFLMSDKYIAEPTGWDSGATTYDPEEAGTFKFMASTNLDEALKIYVEKEVVRGEGEEAVTCPYIVLQDWGGGMGTFPIIDWDNDDTDGESDWYIYNATIAFNVDSVRLLGAIAHANAIAPTEGTNPGCISDISSYTAALEAAIHMAYNGTPDSDYKAAYTALRSAIANLGEPNPFKLNTPYLITSAESGFMKQQGVEKAICCYVDVNLDETVIKWNTLYKEGIDTLGYIWEFVESDTEGQVYIQNYKTKAYIGQYNEIDATVPATEDVEEAGHYQIESVGNAAFAFSSIEAIATRGSYNYLHAAGHGSGAGVSGSLVTWDKVSLASQWKLTEINPDDPTLIDVVDVEPLKVASTSYYTLSGQQISAPAKGINIVKITYANGEVKVNKVLVK